MAHTFLSPEWFTAVDEIRARYHGQTPEISQVVKVDLTVTGAPFQDDPVEAHLDTSSGEMVFGPGHLDDPAVSVTTDYDTARAMFVDQDQAAAMQAFLGGKVQVQGDMMKLMAMNTSVPSTDVTVKMAEEVKAATA